MKRIEFALGALVLSLSFAACGDDEDDDAGGGGSTSGGSTGKGGKGGTATGGTSTGGTATGGRGGSAGAGARGGAGGSAGRGTGGAIAGMGGDGGDAGGEAGEGGMGGEGGGVGVCDPVDPPEMFIGMLSAAQEVPTNASTGVGNAIAELNDAETELTVSVTWSGLTTNTHLGHVHGPAAPGVNAPVLFDLMPPTTDVSGSVVARTFPINATQVAQLKGGLTYVNIHSTMFMAGEIRAQLLPAAVVRTGTLSADQEVPTNSSDGTGRAVVAVYPTGTLAAVSVRWSGLTGPATLGHIHGPGAPGVNAGILFDLMPPAMANGGVTHRFWTTTMQQNTDLLAGLHYANIHSAMYMAGEIRGQLLPPCP